MREKDKWGLNWDTWVKSKFTCVYCGFDGMSSLLAAHQLTVDHIKPRCWNGDDCANNLAAACLACNSIKAGWDRSEYTPEKFENKRIEEVRNAAKAYIDGWYRKWNPGYEEMLKLAAKQIEQPCLHWESRKPMS